MNPFNDIARYAEGDMSAEEQAAFEAALASDASLQQQLALYREVHASLQQHFGANEQRDSLQQTLQTMRREFFTQKTSQAKVVPFKKWLRATAAVAAILIAVLIIWQPFKRDLFKEYAETSMVAPAERGGNANDTLQQAVDAFNKKDFTAAATLLQQVQQRDSANSFAHFYYAVALLQASRIEEARAILLRLYEGTSAFKYEAAFYLALGYLKEKNKNACAEWLRKIPADAPNYNKAQELLRKL